MNDALALKVPKLSCNTGVQYLNLYVQKPCLIWKIVAEN